MKQRIDSMVNDWRKMLYESFLGKAEPIKLDVVEGAACDLREKFGRDIVQEIIQAQVDETESQEQEDGVTKCACQGCKRQIPFRGVQKRTVVTMAGDVCVKRRAHYCKRCKMCTMPTDIQLGLPPRTFTRSVELSVGRLCVKDTFESAMDDLSGMARVSVSPKEAQRITIALGQQAQKAMAKDMAMAMPKNPRSPHLRLHKPEKLAPQLDDPTLIAYISMDGVMVPIRGLRINEKGKQERYVVWTEAKLGRVDLVQKPTKDGEDSKTISSHFTYTLDGPDVCGKQTYAIAARAGVTKLRWVVVISDGAEWIRKRFKEHFPYAIHILDWYHAVEHLGNVLRVCLTAALAKSSPRGKVDETKLKEWCKKLAGVGKTLMIEGKTKQLIKFIKKLPQVTADAVESVRQTTGYYLKNISRMKYNEYIDKGLRIGSGAMESGCKQVADFRMKRSGMCWSVEGATAMGALRCEFLSTGRWETLFGEYCGRPRHAASV